ncbi:hypothetical protein [Streptomyces sp. NPDC059761]|uniref:hypothetical protein n=1 Tax=Streptomyces sp. NPDC059761 TaxID=3346937 RepID=UPI00364A70D0
MRLKEIKPGRVYAIKAADNNIVPGLALDSILWHRLLDPEKGVHYFEPAEDQTWSTTASFGTSSEKRKNLEEGIELGQRSGVLTVAPAVGTPDAKKLVAQLEELSKGLGGKGIERTTEVVAAFQQSLSDPLRLDVTRTDYIRTLWERHVSGESKRTCPLCGERVEMSAASRLLTHSQKNGTRCPRSRTPLTAEERKAQ